MTDTTPTPIISTESPASWNTRYIDPSGFDCQLTLRANSGAELLKKAAAAVAALIDAGCIPANYNRPQTPPPPPPAAPAPQEPPKLANGAVDPAWCAVHNLAMKRHEKDGQVWYSHKEGDTYCRGKK